MSTSGGWRGAGPRPGESGGRGPGRGPAPGVIVDQEPVALEGDLPFDEALRRAGTGRRGGGQGGQRHQSTQANPFHLILHSCRYTYCACEDGRREGAVRGHAVASATFAATSRHVTAAVAPRR